MAASPHLNPTTNTCTRVQLLLLLLLSTFFSVQLAVGREVLNVADLGAAPDGKTDATDAFIRAWSTACGSPEPGTVYVPAGNFLVVGPAVFRGRCNNTRMEFRVEGTIAAAGDYSSVGDMNHWIKFEHVHGLSIYGGGMIDGQGAALWECKVAARPGKDCPLGAKSLAISHSDHVQVSDLTSINSKFFHIMVSGSSNIRLHNLTIFAPGDSPNTDGIHVQGSDDVKITNATIRTGDDCISMGPGTTNLLADGIFCGPGHGISIGSLGIHEDEAGVQNITVRNVVFDGTQNGVRIKTWARPSQCFVDGVSFQNANMNNVRNPITIDQNYCPHNVNCPSQGSGVKISNITYSGIQGTSASQIAVGFDCSPRQPCNAILMQDVNLTYQNQAAQSFCNHVDGTTSGYIIPPSCLWR